MVRLFNSGLFTFMIFVNFNNLLGAPALGGIANSVGDGITATREVSEASSNLEKLGSFTQLADEAKNGGIQAEHVTTNPPVIQLSESSQSSIGNHIPDSKGGGNIKELMAEQKSRFLLWSQKLAKIISEPIVKMVTSIQPRPLLTKIQDYSTSWLDYYQKAHALWVPRLKRIPDIGWDVLKRNNRLLSNKDLSKVKPLNGPDSKVSQEEASFREAIPYKVEQTMKEKSDSKGNRRGRTKKIESAKVIKQGAENDESLKTLPATETKNEKVKKSKADDQTIELIMHNFEKQREELQQLINLRRANLMIKTDKSAEQSKPGLMASIKTFFKKLITSNNYVKRLRIWWRKKQLNYFAIKSLEKEKELWQKLEAKKPAKLQEIIDLAKASAKYRGKFHSLNADMIKN
ncbi:expressed protein, partial [Phakopsora pachyrhizi]